MVSPYIPVQIIRPIPRRGGTFRRPHIATPFPINKQYQYHWIVELSCLFLFIFVCLFVCCFMSHERTFRSRGDVTVVGEGLHRFDLCSHMWLLSREGSSSCHIYCMWHGVSFLWLHPRKHPNFFAFYDMLTVPGTYSNLEPHKNLVYTKIAFY